MTEWMEDSASESSVKTISRKKNTSRIQNSKLLIGDISNLYYSDQIKDEEEHYGKYIPEINEEERSISSVVDERELSSSYSFVEKDFSLDHLNELVSEPYLKPKVNWNPNTHIAFYKRMSKFDQEKKLLESLPSTKHKQVAGCLAAVTKNQKAMERKKKTSKISQEIFVIDFLDEREEKPKKSKRRKISDLLQFIFERKGKRPFEASKDMIFIVKDEDDEEITGETREGPSIREPHEKIIIIIGGRFNILQSEDELETENVRETTHRQRLLNFLNTVVEECNRPCTISSCQRTGSNWPTTEEEEEEEDEDGQVNEKAKERKLIIFLKNPSTWEESRWVTKFLHYPWMKRLNSDEELTNIKNYAEESLEKLITVLEQVESESTIESELSYWFSTSEMSLPVFSESSDSPFTKKMPKPRPAKMVNSPTIIKLRRSPFRKAGIVKAKSYPQGPRDITAASLIQTPGPRPTTFTEVTTRSMDDSALANREERFSLGYRWDSAVEHATDGDGAGASATTARPAAGSHRLSPAALLNRIIIPRKVLLMSAVGLILFITIIIAISIVIWFGRTPNRTYNPDNSSEKKGKSLRIFPDFRVVFHKALVNFTNAAQVCKNEKMELMVLQSAREERKLISEVKRNRRFLHSCPVSYIGFRSVLDEEWVSMGGDVKGGGSLMTAIWDSISYVSATHNCSHASKILDYRLNNVDCRFPHDCILCETYHGCLYSDSCLSLESASGLDFLDAELYCQKVLRGHLAPIANAVSRQRMLKVLKRDDPRRRCSVVATGMVLKRQFETLDEIKIPFRSKFIHFNEGNINHHCLAVKSRGDTVFISPADCSIGYCFLCRKELYT